MFKPRTSLIIAPKSGVKVVCFPKQQRSEVTTVLAAITLLACYQISGHNPLLFGDAEDDDVN